MADGLVKMQEQFKGLPMADLIGGPLQAACDAQTQLARATADFIDTVGMNPVLDAEGNPTGEKKARTVDFAFKRPYQDPNTGDVGSEEVELSVPLLALVKTPALAITDVNVTFDMEVKSSTSEKSVTKKEGKFSASAKYGFGPFSAKVNVSGSVSSHKENQRSSDNSAKYHVEVVAKDSGTPEGLSRVLDILQSAIAPTKVTPKVEADEDADALPTPKKKK